MDYLERFDSSSKGDINGSKAKRKNFIQGSSFDGSLLDTPIYNEELMNNFIDGIVQNIQMEMDKQGITVRGLGEMSGVNYSHITRILNGNSHIGLPVLIKVAYALHLSPGDLFPMDINKRKTNGQRFDEMTKRLDLESSNFLLNLCADYTKELRRISEKKG